MTLNLAPISLSCLVFLLFVGCVSSPKPQNPVPEPKNTEALPAPQAPAQPLAPEEPSFRLSDEVVPLSYNLHLKTDPGQMEFTGEVAIITELKKPTLNFFLHGKNINIQKMKITTKDKLVEANFKVFKEEEQIGIFFKEPQLPQILTIKFNYTAPYSTDLDGLYRVVVEETPYLFTQMEPIAARTFIPCFDEPKFKTPFQMKLTIPKDQKAVTNMPLLNSKIENEQTHLTFLPSPPLPTYLLALIVGPLEEVVGPSIPATDIRPQPIALTGFAVKGKGANLKYALENTGKILLALESYFGMAHPYPKIDIIAVPDFSAGAMENPGAITFKEWLLLLDEKESGINQKRAFYNVMTHELVHQWFGNYVTLSWWNDLWLNEAFATFIGRKITYEVYPESEAMVKHLRSSHSAMNADSLPAARKIRQPIVNHHDIHNAFDGITYSKGAAFLSMIESLVGPQQFQAGISEFLRQHANNIATADDLLFAIEAQSNQPITGLAKTFLEQAGVPQIEIKSQCDEKGAQLHLAQERYFKMGLSAEQKPLWKIPMCFKIGDTDQKCIVFDQKQSVVPLNSCPDWFFPNRNADGYYRFVQSPEDNKKLIKNIGLLNLPEKLALADSLKAAFKNGTMTFESLLPYLYAYGQMPERVLSIAFKDIFFFANDTVWDKNPPEAFRKLVRNIYRKPFKKVSYTPLDGESDEIKLQRAALFEILYYIGDHPGIKKWLRKNGKKMLRAKELGKDTSFMPTELRPLAIDVLMKDKKLSQNVLKRISKLLEKETDPPWRGLFTRSLGKTPYLKNHSQILGWLEKDRLRKSERSRILWSLMDNPIFREPTWAYFKDNYDHLKTIIPKGSLSYTPYLPSVFCDSNTILDLQSFFNDKVAEVPGAPRNLQKSIESIQTCEALKVFHSTSLELNYGEKQ